MNESSNSCKKQLFHVWQIEDDICTGKIIIRKYVCLEKFIRDHTDPTLLFIYNNVDLLSRG